MKLRLFSNDDYNWAFCGISDSVLFVSDVKLKIFATSGNRALVGELDSNNHLMKCLADEILTMQTTSLKYRMHKQTDLNADS